MNVVLLVLGVVVVLALLWAILTYNTAVTMRQILKNAWSQIDVQLKRRHDLIQNLVEVAKGYMAHERETLENVIKARQQAVDAKGLKDLQAAENFLTGALRSLFAVSERYPELKADNQMRRLHEELVSTENRIAFARQFYNDEAARYNAFLQSFPNNLFLPAFGFKTFDYFELESPDESQAPQVRF